ncbi:hypothetical protein [Nonomuraea dietziae]|uniref:hypothetical protein n=1 Tax=Nonomuraea dietziae TaxID=65515 RepID=UPI0031D486E2
MNTQEWTVVRSPRSTLSAGWNGCSGSYHVASYSEWRASRPGAAERTTSTSSAAQAVDASGVVGLLG